MLMRTMDISMIPNSLIEAKRAGMSFPHGGELEKYAEWEMGGSRTLIDDRRLSSRPPNMKRSSTSDDMAGHGIPGAAPLKALRSIIGRSEHAP